MVGEKSLEVLLSIGREEEGVDARSELRESKIGWGKEGTAGVGSVELVEKARLGEAELEGGELAGKESDDLQDIRRRDDDGVNTVNDTVAAELRELLAH